MFIQERETLPCLGSCMWRAGTMHVQEAHLHGRQEEREGRGECDLYPFRYLQWQNAAYKPAAAGFREQAQTPLRMQLPIATCDTWASPRVSEHLNSNMRPVCHRSELAVVILIVVLFLHPDFLIPKPQHKSCTAPSRPCGKAMLNLYACGVSGSIAIFSSEEFV